MLDKPQIIINSFPRTGSVFLKTAINIFMNANQLDDHLHSVFLGSKKIENTFQISIVRNPIDTLVSNVYRDFGEFKYKRSLDQNHGNVLNYFEHGIDSHFNFTNNWYKNFLESVIDNDTCLKISFEEMSKDILSVLEKISKITKMDFKKEEDYTDAALSLLGNDIVISSDKISETVFKYIQSAKWSSQVTMTSGNIPREVGEEYLLIKKYVWDHVKDIEESLKIYKNIIGNLTI